MPSQTSKHFIIKANYSLIVYKPVAEYTFIMASIQQVVIMHFNEQVRQSVHLQVKVKSYGQHTYIPKAMKSYSTAFFANESVLSQVLCCIHNISMYLDECLTKRLAFGKKWSHKKNSPPKL